jgi:hypothetical protein
MYFLSSAEGIRFAEIATEMTERARQLGPNPLKNGRRRQDPGPEKNGKGIEPPTRTEVEE